MKSNLRNIGSNLQKTFPDYYLDVSFYNFALAQKNKYKKVNLIFKQIVFIKIRKNFYGNHIEIHIIGSKNVI